MSNRTCRDFYCNGGRWRRLQLQPHLPRSSPAHARLMGVPSLPLCIATACVQHGARVVRSLSHICMCVLVVHAVRQLRRVHRHPNSCQGHAGKSLPETPGRASKQITKCISQSHDTSPAGMHMTYDLETVHTMASVSSVSHGFTGVVAHSPLRDCK